MPLQLDSEVNPLPTQDPERREWSDGARNRTRMRGVCDGSPEEVLS